MAILHGPRDCISCPKMKFNNYNWAFYRVKFAVAYTSRVHWHRATNTAIQKSNAMKCNDKKKINCTACARTYFVPYYSVCCCMVGCLLLWLLLLLLPGLPAVCFFFHYFPVLLSPIYNMSMQLPHFIAVWAKQHSRKNCRLSAN